LVRVVRAIKLNSGARARRGPCLAPGLLPMRALKVCPSRLDLVRRKAAAQMTMRGLIVVAVALDVAALDAVQLLSDLETLDHLCVETTPDLGDLVSADRLLNGIETAIAHLTNRLSEL
jgi:hypothetical protein